ncbi:MAG TPA: hypothetical protein VMU16_06730 [Candidatus Binataceae bacterium]|nr:hypothetical protein [Candidatus Binataceae bacterium]
MKKALAALLSLSISLSVLSVAALAQTTPKPKPTPRFSAREAARHHETVKGRIVKLDANAGTFSVRIGATGRVVDLTAGERVKLNRLRRDEPVIVTFSGKVATKVEATWSEK